jgi:hypothetical protein
VPISASHGFPFSVSFGEISWLGGNFLNFGFCRNRQR